MRAGKRSQAGETHVGRERSGKPSNIGLGRAGTNVKFKDFGREKQTGRWVYTDGKTLPPTPLHPPIFDF